MNSIPIIYLSIFYCYNIEKVLYKLPLYKQNIHFTSYLYTIL